MILTLHQVPTTWSTPNIHGVPTTSFNPPKSLLMTKLTLDQRATTGFVNDVQKSDLTSFDQYLIFFDETFGNHHHITCTLSGSNATTGFVHDVPKSDRLLFDRFLIFFGTVSCNRHHITCTFGESRPH